MLNLTNFKEQFVLALHRKKAVVPRETKFRRCLNALELVSFGVGSIIGMYAVFACRSCINFQRLGNICFNWSSCCHQSMKFTNTLNKPCFTGVQAGPAVVISFAFAGILSMLNALFYAELACRVPQTGSAYRYLVVNLLHLKIAILTFN